MRETDLHNPPMEDPEPLGYEAGMPPYSRLEGHILTGLDHMLQRSLQIKNDLTERPSIAYGAIDSKGVMHEKYFDIDGRFLSILNETIMNRHTFYLKGDAKLEGSAQGIRDARYEEVNGKVLEPHELSKMWDAD